MLCNIKPVPFHESDKHIFAKIPGGVRTPGPPSGSAHALVIIIFSVCQGFFNSLTLHDCWNSGFCGKMVNPLPHNATF